MASNIKLEDEGLLHKIVDLSDLLERCQFRDFWTLLRQEKANYDDVVKHVAGFEDGVREFILHIVSKTYQTIAFDELKEILGDLTSNKF